MQWFLSLKLIRFFDFYLALMFFAGVMLRYKHYSMALDLVRAVPSRWPRLFKLVGNFRHIFLTWGTLSPLILSLGLFLIHTILRRIFLSDRDALTVEMLTHTWLGIPVLISALAMFAFDLWGVFQVAPIDQPEMEKYFDQAEYWLSSWTAPVVKVFTLGYVNPRRMVRTEVQSALVSVSEMINSTLWWMVVQISLRLVFGITLWFAFAQLQ